MLWRIRELATSKAPLARILFGNLEDYRLAVVVASEAGTLAAQWRREPLVSPSGPGWRSDLLGGACDDFECDCGG